MPLRADGSPVWVQVSWLADHRPHPPSRGPLPQWRLSDGGSPLTVARQLRFHTGFPWCPPEILLFTAAGPGMYEVGGGETPLCSDLAMC